VNSTPGGDVGRDGEKVPSLSGDTGGGGGQPTLVSEPGRGTVGSPTAVCPARRFSAHLAFLKTPFWMGLLILAVVGGMWLLFSPAARHYRMLGRRARELEREIEVLRQREEVLTARRNALRDDPVAMERELRLRQALTRPGEVAFIIPHGAVLADPEVASLATMQDHAAVVIFRVAAIGAAAIVLALFLVTIGRVSG